MKWNELAALFGEKLNQDLTDKIASGPLKLPSGESFYVTAHFHSKGIRIGKRFRPLFWKKLWIRWDKAADVAVLPSQFPESLSMYTDANVTIRNDQVQRMSVPWRTDVEKRW